MKFAWDTVLTDMAGKQLTDETGAGVQLGSLVVQALLTPQKTELDALGKFKRYQLAVKVHNGQDVDVTEAALIKEACGSVLTPLPLGRVWELLEHPLP